MNEVEAIAWAVVAYMSNPEADDTEVAAILVRHGFGPRLAERATTMLPVAFGRSILRSLVTLPETYLEDGIEHAFAADPVFVAAEARAERARREEIDRIGSRSAEVRAVNAALHAGSKPENLLLSSPVMTTSERADPPAASPNEKATAMVQELVAAHGSQLAHRAFLFPSKLTLELVQLQIDLELRSPRIGDRMIRESFAGWGPTVEVAIGDTIKKFSQSSFHVVMATLEAEALGGNQVEWETWGDFRVCTGGLLRQWSADTQVDFAAYLDALKARLLAAELPATIHWYRSWLGYSTKLLGFDALLDNDEWAPGVALIERWPWPTSDREYALRHFFVMVPTSPRS